MSEIRERAKEWLNSKSDRKTITHEHAIIRDLLAEVERLGKNLRLVQSHAKSAMDKLPERWNMAFQAGLEQAIPYKKELTDALAAERESRKDDNATLTEDILKLEAENERLKALEDKMGSGWALVEYDKARIQAARECIEIIDKYPAFLFGTDAVGVKLNLGQSIKAHFGLDGQRQG